MTGNGGDIAAVVNIHREGRAAVPSLVSAWRAVEHARNAGIPTELVIVLDDPDAESVTTANEWVWRGARIMPVEVRDPGHSRNAAVRGLKAEWISFLDADDLWGESWLTKAYSAATRTVDPSVLDVWHPRVNAMFAASQSLLHHIDSTDDDFSLARLRLNNAWTVLSFVRREHLLAVPFPRIRLDAGFGFEDWSWNIEVLRRGGRHRIVEDTVHAVYRNPAAGRVAPTNVLTRSQTSLRSPYPDPIVEAAPLPGRTVAISELSPVDDDLPPQFRRMPVELSDGVYDDLRRAAMIAPAIANTIGTPGEPDVIAQNSNRHVTASQRALEELDLAREANPDASLGEVLDSAQLIGALDPVERHRVVAELVLDPTSPRRDSGESSLIEGALAALPQLREFI